MVPLLMVVAVLAAITVLVASDYETECKSPPAKAASSFYEKFSIFSFIRWATEKR